MSHKQWEAQLSGIIERTNANLSALSSRYEPQRAAPAFPNHVEPPQPPAAARGGATLRDACGGGERYMERAPSEPSESWMERVCERVAARLGDEKVRRLEEDIAQLRAATERAATSARAHDSAVEQLSRESHARKGAASKMMAWQADSEAWRSRVDAELDVAARRGCELDRAHASVKDALARSATTQDVRACAENANLSAAAAAAAAMAPVQQRVEKELETLRFSLHCTAGSFLVSFFYVAVAAAAAAAVSQHAVRITQGGMSF